MSGTKHCKRCDRDLPLSKFNKDKNRPDGLAFYCKNCVSEEGQRFRSTALGVFGLIKGRQTHFRKINSTKVKPFNLKKEVFVEWYDKEPKVCHYCEIPEDKLYLFNKKFNIRGRRLSVDCKDNALGYILENLVLACDKCNITKNNALTHDEMLFVGKNFIKPKWESMLTETVKEEDE